MLIGLKLHPTPIRPVMDIFWGSDTVFFSQYGDVGCGSMTIRGHSMPLDREFLETNGADDPEAMYSGIDHRLGGVGDGSCRGDGRGEGW